jgi:hypothetical protein
VRTTSRFANFIRNSEEAGFESATTTTTTTSAPTHKRPKPSTILDVYNQATKSLLEVYNEASFSLASVYQAMESSPSAAPIKFPPATTTTTTSSSSSSSSSAPQTGQLHYFNAITRVSSLNDSGSLDNDADANAGVAKRARAKSLYESDSDDDADERANVKRARV